MTGNAPVNIAAHVSIMARRRPDAPAVYAPSGRGPDSRRGFVSWTFRRLEEESDCLARGLETVGVRRHVRTVLMVTPGLEFFALTFALFKVGAVPVVMDPGMGIKNLGRCLAEAEAEAFIGIPRAHAARALLGWGRKTLRIRVTVGRRLFWGGYGLDDIRAAGRSDRPYAMAGTRAEDTAAILFTSGSTGPPKGAVYTHGIFAAQVEQLRRIYGIEAGEVDLATFPLFALFDPALGMTAVLPDMDATRPGRVVPENILDPIQRYGVTNMFGSPALLDRVGRYGADHGVKLPSLRRVISAGAPAQAPVLQRFQSMLAPGVEVFTPYGATESLPVASIGSQEILGETAARTAEGAGVCVGRPVPEMEVAVVRITDSIMNPWSPDLEVPRGEIGELAVQGPVVTRAYLNRPQATALAKIPDPDRSGFYHRMGDVGYLDDQGRIWFCGRKSHRVRTARGTLFTLPCEGVFNAHPEVYRTALVGVGPEGAKEPVLCVELEPFAGRDRARIRRELLELGVAHGHTRGIKTVLFHRDFPVDIRHNAKIFREKLAVWAARRVR